VRYASAFLRFPALEATGSSSWGRRPARPAACDCRPSHWCIPALSPFPPCTGAGNRSRLQPVDKGRAGTHPGLHATARFHALAAFRQPGLPGAEITVRDHQRCVGPPPWIQQRARAGHQPRPNQRYYSQLTATSRPHIPMLLSAARILPARQHHYRLVVLTAIAPMDARPPRIENSTETTQPGFKASSVALDLPHDLAGDGPRRPALQQCRVGVVVVQAGKRPPVFKVGPGSRQRRPPADPGCCRRSPVRGQHGPHQGSGQSQLSIRGGSVT
jgi:hypothetical protein